MLARGFQQAVLWVFSANTAARLFYEAMGFSTDGAIRTLNLDAPISAIRFRKAL